MLQIRQPYRATAWYLVWFLPFSSGTPTQLLPKQGVSWGELTGEGIGRSGSRFSLRCASGMGSRGYDRQLDTTRGEITRRQSVP